MPIENQTDTEKVYITEPDAAILGDIVGHPYELPTFPELVFMNRDLGKETVKDRLRRLIKQGVLEKVTFENGPPQENYPDTFFGLTDFGSELFHRRVPEDREGTLKDAYSSVDKPDVIKNYERAPRPPKR